MKKTIYTFLALTALVGFGQASQAQTGVVTDPRAEQELGTLVEMNNTNIIPHLNQIELYGQDTVNSVSGPTGVLGGFVGMDGGATANSADDTAKILPALDGQTFVGAAAGELETQEDADHLADETSALASGNYEDVLTSRLKKASTNIQGQAVGDFRVFAQRLIDSDKMEAKLAKQTTLIGVDAYAALIMLEAKKSIDLLGQAETANTIALEQAQLRADEQYQYYKDDYLAAAVAIK